MKSTSIIALLLTLAAPPLRADNVTLGFGSLPSAQGWNFEGGLDETASFSVSGGSLFQDTIGEGFGADTGAFYRFLTPILEDVPFTLDFRARVTASEIGGLGTPFGFAVLFNDSDGETTGFGFTAGRIADISVANDTMAVDTTVFHDYRVVGQYLGTGGAAYSLFVDANPVPVLVSTAAQAPGFGVPNNLILGDVTQSSNARAELTAYQFAQVPEPSSVGLLLLGGGLGFMWRKSRHRTISIK